MGYGIRTVVGLRTVGAEDYEPDEGQLPTGLTFIRLMIEDVTTSTSSSIVS